MSRVEMLLSRLERLLARLMNGSVRVLRRHQAPLRMHHVLRLAVLLRVSGGDDPGLMSLVSGRCLSNRRLGGLRHSIRRLRRTSFRRAFERAQN